MIVGTKDLFAIEAYLSQHDNYVFIRYCFWVKSCMIGDLEQSTLLTSVIPVLESTLTLKGQRKFVEFDGYKAQEILPYLVRMLWKPDHLSAIQIAYSEQDLRKADINSHEGESFQGFYTFLIEHDTYDWLLCKDAEVERLSEVKLPKQMFYKFVKHTLDWIDGSTVLVLRPEYNAD